MIVLAAITRGDVADFVRAAILVYVLLIIIYVLLSLVFSLGARVPYNRWTDAVLGFLRDVCEPYLSIFRRFIPMIGPLDISPIVAILVLQIVGGLIVNVIRG
jgi:YggT family protein